MFSNSPSVILDEAGKYTLFVTDTLTGCGGMDSILIRELTDYPPVPSGPDGELNCIQDSLVLNDGLMYTVDHVRLTWNSADGLILSDPSLISIVAGAPGMYILEAVDTTNGCANLDTVQVFANLSRPNASAGEDVLIDCDEDFETLSAENSTQGDSILVTWTGPGIDAAQLHQWNVQVDVPGIYLLEVMNMHNGCTDYDSVEVMYNPDVPTTLLFSLMDPVCFGDTNGLLNIQTVSGGEPMYQYSLNGDSLSAELMYSGLSPGTHTLAVVDANGCRLDTTFVLQQPDSVEINVVPFVELSIGDSLQLFPEFNIPMNEIASIDWSPGEWLTCTDCLNPVFTGIQDDTITIKVMTIDGCPGEANIIVRVDRESTIFIPNVFTPNDDHVNDWFTIFSDNSVRQVLKMEIFGRWGNKVFERMEFSPGVEQLGWDGTFRGQPLDPGVFVYRIEIAYMDGRIEVLHGDVTIIK